MTLKSYIEWLKSKKLGVKIFLFIILIKPFLDIFYDLSLGGGLTLLKLFGIIIALICIATIAFKRRVVRGGLLNFLFIWSTLYTINLVLSVLFNLNIDSLAQNLKMGMTVYILFFYFRQVREDIDVVGFLHTYLLSLIFLIGGFFYSDFFIKETEITRGAERIITVYGDIGSIGIQYNLGFITLIFLSGISENLRKDTTLKKIIPLYVLIGFYILIKIHHSASYIIFFLLLGYYFYLSSKENFFRSIGLGFIIALPVAIYFWEDIYNNLNNLLNTDIAVVQGEKEATQAFHGRGGRWAEHWSYFSDGGILNYVFGLVGIKHIELLGHGSHNDYLRLTYASGFLGSLCWLMFNVAIILKVSFWKVYPTVKFGIIAVILFWMLQAVSLTPSSYHAFNFVYGPLIVLAVRWKK